MRNPIYEQTKSILSWAHYAEWIIKENKKKKYDLGMKTEMPDVQV